jgi:hypothetical protein
MFIINSPLNKDYIIQNMILIIKQHKILSNPNNNPVICFMFLNYFFLSSQIFLYLIFVLVFTYLMKINFYYNAFLALSFLLSFFFLIQLMEIFLFLIRGCNFIKVILLLAVFRLYSYSINYIYLYFYYVCLFVTRVRLYIQLFESGFEVRTTVLGFVSTISIIYFLARISTLVLSLVFANSGIVINHSAGLFNEHWELAKIDKLEGEIENSNNLVEGAEKTKTSSEDSRKNYEQGNKNESERIESELESEHTESESGRKNNTPISENETAENENEAHTPRRESAETAESNITNGSDYPESTITYPESFITYPESHINYPENTATPPNTPEPTESSNIFWELWENISSCF